VRWLVFFGVFMCFLNSAVASDGNASSVKNESMPLNLSAEEFVLLPYERPKAFDWLTDSPENLLSFIKRIHPKENIWWLAGIGLSTAVLIKYDQAIMDESQRFARRLGLISDTKTGRETYTIIDFSVGEFPLPLIIPKNVNSVMYFIGDGLTHLGIVGGLLGYGLKNDDNRALSTASQTLEALLVTGVVVQVIKRTTGRESGFTASRPGGKWRFFPNQLEYTRNVPKFDAYPSGHMATVMATTTVLAENYPEHKYIRPLGYTLMAIMGFGMTNNGVHWVSDYPLAIGIGYIAAKGAVERNRKKRWLKSRGMKLSREKIPGRIDLDSIVPYASANAFGLTYQIRF